MALYAKSPETYRMVPRPATSEWNLAEYINILKRVHQSQNGRTEKVVTLANGGSLSTRAASLFPKIRPSLECVDVLKMPIISSLLPEAFLKTLPKSAALDAAGLCSGRACSQPHHTDHD